MSAEFRNIQDVFAENNLRLPTLNVLVPDAHLYETLAIQPGGQIAVRPDFIGHADHPTAASQFSDFLRLAVEKNCDLVLSPEYSCPWETLTNAIARQALPKEGKIWILGCESITPDELLTIKATHGNVVWIHEPISEGSGSFVDVVAYVTKAEATVGGTKDVIVLQFKTQAMGGTTFERDHLICGRSIYIWHNPRDNIRLISLICSEALVFDPATAATCGFDLHPYLIFHPQLTPAPHHPDISAYREQVFGWNVSENIEVVSLNWARSFVLLGNPPSRYGGSAIYTKSRDFVSDDNRLEANHQKGLFYTFWHDRRTHLCRFSFDSHVFHFRIPKTRQDVPAVLAARTGPEMLTVWNWDTQRMSWQKPASVDDGFAALCGTFQQQNCDYCLNAPHSSVDRERLLTLSAGKLRAARDWHLVHKMDSFIAERDERSKRLTFTHEPAAASNDSRRDHLARFVKLQMTVLADPANFPPTIQDLRGDWRLQPPRADGFRFNLVSVSGHAQGATAIFVGLEPPDTVQQLMDDLVREWGKIETRRLVIWHEFQNRIVPNYQPLPSITDDAESPASITRPATP